MPCFLFPAFGGWFCFLPCFALFCCFLPAFACFILRLRRKNIISGAKKRGQRKGKNRIKKYWNKKEEEGRNPFSHLLFRGGGRAFLGVDFVVVFWGFGGWFLGFLVVFRFWGDYFGFAWWFLSVCRDFLGLCGGFGGQPLLRVKPAMTFLFFVPLFLFLTCGQVVFCRM